MSLVQKLAWVYAVGFFLVVAVGYVPGFVDENGLLFGGFKIDPIDDVVHGVSGLWAAWAAWSSEKSARKYFKIFGTFYTADAFVGFFTGLAIVEIVQQMRLVAVDYSFTNFGTNLAVNLPHFIIGPLAMWIGWRVK